MNETTSETDNPQLPVLPPVLLLGAVAVAIVLDWTPLRFLSPPVGFNLQVLAGLVLTAGGFWLAWSARALFEREGTNVIPTQPTLKVVTSGPYRYTRNPMYLGMVIVLLGLSLVFSLEWGAILTPVLWLVLDRMIVAREEAYLSRKFGAEYQALLARTRRWL
ncbi:methyltransferase family protein [Devosia nitrariae]|uniref:Protein-S-isoprenylcysteine methyltransferase n=1 Tax=Devosia nitrariae TaxID=2071872 RepID=A0ABQ5W5L7_9HYPH|nr:isoprenylcysteine carboxylmethyltransferase family protein [Devosia nitrariae]GLQ55079.1 protein-S-isoprenylcysteine methyltransferase [Devosia nitrariae]